MEARSNKDKHVASSERVDAAKRKIANDRIKSLYRDAIKKTSVDKDVVRCCCDC